MLNRNGFTRGNFGAPTQILANVDLQSSVGCIVPQTLGVAVGNRLIAKAGTPIAIDLMTPNIPVEAASGNMNAVLLHDVDVTVGNANGTALIFGFVNVNRVDAEVQTLIESVIAAQGNTGMVMFLRV